MNINKTIYNLRKLYLLLKVNKRLHDVLGPSVIPDFGKPIKKVSTFLDYYLKAIKYKMVYLVRYIKYFFKIGIHSMQGLTATARHGVTRKRSTKRLRYIGHLLRKNLPLKAI